MKVKEYLFVYGSLRPSEDPPKSMTDPESDWINGDEIQKESRHHHHWAEVRLHDGHDLKIKGYTMLIDANELSDLDKREAPEYRRIRVTTHNRHVAWVYEYVPAHNRPKAGKTFSVSH